MIFSQSQSETAARLLVKAREKKLKIVTAESCTGGLIGACLTEIPGASDVFERGFITYSNAAKSELLGVPASLISVHGAVSEEVAKAMAEGALKHSQGDLSIAVTGVAGPGGGTPEKPVGLVHLTSVGPGGAMLHVALRLGDISRTEIRLKSVDAGLILLLRLLQ